MRRFIPIVLLVFTLACLSSTATQSVTPSNGQGDQSSPAPSVTLEGESGYSPADSSGKITLKTPEYGAHDFAVQNSDGEGVGGAKIQFASNAEGILILVMPPDNTNYLGGFSYFPAEKLGFLNGSARLAKQVVPEPNAIHIWKEDEENAPVAEEMEVPPSLLEDFYKSKEFTTTVMKAHALCEFFSTSTLIKEINIVDKSRVAVQAVIMNMKWNLLAKKLLSDLPTDMLNEGFLELCLAATGDPKDLKDFTAVVNEAGGFGTVLMDEEMPSVIKGKVKDESTGAGLGGVTMNIGGYETKTLGDGTFFASTKKGGEVDVGLSFYQYKDLLTQFNITDPYFQIVGDVLLEKIVRLIPEDFYLHAEGTIWQAEKDGAREVSAKYTRDATAIGMVTDRVISIQYTESFSLDYFIPDPPWVVNYDVYTGRQVQNTSTYVPDTATPTTGGEGSFPTMNIAGKEVPYSKTTETDEFDLGNGYTMKCDNIERYRSAYITMTLKYVRDCPIYGPKGLWGSRKISWEVVDTNANLLAEP